MDSHFVVPHGITKCLCVYFVFRFAFYNYLIVLILILCESLLVMELYHGLPVEDSIMFIWICVRSNLERFSFMHCCYLLNCWLKGLVRPPDEFWLSFDICMHLIMSKDQTRLAPNTLTLGPKLFKQKVSKYASTHHLIDI